MEKGKFGFRLYLYPLLMLLCVLFSSVWAGLIILGFVLVAEKNEQATRQTLHALLYFFVWQFYLLATSQLMTLYEFVMRRLTSWFSWSLLYNGVSNIRGFFYGVGSLIYLAFVVVILFMGVLPLLKGKDMKLPGKNFVDKLYGEATKKSKDGDGA